MTYFNTTQKTASAGYGASRGFTLIETLIAIFILTLTVGGLLTLAANGYFSVRYARNQITADSLVQESLEYVRNSRDSAAQSGVDWQTWVGQFSANGCMSSTGCIVDPYTTNGNNVRACGNTCDYSTLYPDSGFYGYTSSSYPSALGSTTPPQTSTFVRTITMHLVGANQLVVVSSVQWLNGTAAKGTTQSILITSWPF
jgi:Tfp pilus assembly protein PilV